MKTHLLSTLLIVLCVLTPRAPAQEEVSDDRKQAEFELRLAQSVVWDSDVGTQIPKTQSAYIEFRLRRSPAVRRARADVESALATLDETRSRMTAEAIKSFSSRERLLLGIKDLRKRSEVEENDERKKGIEKMLRETLKLLSDFDRTLITYTSGDSPYAPFRRSSAQGIGKDSIGGLATPFSAATPRPTLVPAPRPQFPEGVDEQLSMIVNSPVSIVFEKIDIRELLEFLSDTYELNFNVDAALPAVPITINLRNVSMRNALLATTENAGDLCFVFRDYGFFVTTSERAMTMNAPAIPPNIPLLVPTQVGSPMPML